MKLLPNASSKIRLAQITTLPLDPAALQAALTDPAGGAIALFIGAVRNHDEGRSVSSLSYSAHPSAVARLQDLLSQYAERADVLALAVEHRVGDLGIGDIAVLAGVTSAHRAAAFEVCSTLVERVKLEIPIWKNQVFADGTNEWIGSS